jgi:hypothetical protein
MEQEDYVFIPAAGSPTVAKIRKFTYQLLVIISIVAFVALFSRETILGIGVMVRSMSYVDPEYKTPALLEHEQLHFDISEYFARQLLIEFQRAIYTKNFLAEIKAIKQRSVTTRNTVENLYDEQSNHGLNPKMQSKWRQYVEYLLSENESLSVTLQKLPKL